MQHTKFVRTDGAPGRAYVRRRVGLDPAMAKAIARSEFGRFYVDDEQQREVQRSLDRAKPQAAKKRAAEPAPLAAKPEERPKTKPKLWHQPSVRERRTELAQARARIAAAAKLRATKKGGER